MVSAGGFDQGVEGGGAVAEPLQGLGLDGEVLRVAGLYVGLDQGVESAAQAGLVAPLDRRQMVQAGLHRRTRILWGEGGTFIPCLYNDCAASRSGQRKAGAFRSPHARG